MTFKEFKKWYYERKDRNTLTLKVDSICIDILEEMKHTPFWERKKRWNQVYKNVAEDVIARSVYEVYRNKRMW